MSNNFKKKISFMLILVVIFNFLLPYFIGGQVLAKAEAGDIIIIPSDLEQCGGMWEPYDISWDSTSDQRKLYDKWVENGKKRTDQNWCYIDIGKKPRYIVALAQTFGLSGDYVDIYVTYDGKERVYPCIIGDSKNTEDDNIFMYNGVAMGHESYGQCSIVEVCATEEPTEDENEEESLKSLKGVTQIRNGGNIEQFPDGPVGLDGEGKYVDINSLAGESSGGIGLFSGSEESTVAGAFGALFRSLWSTMCVIFDNHIYKTNDSTVLYSLES